MDSNLQLLEALVRPGFIVKFNPVYQIFLDLTALEKTGKQVKAGEWTCNSNCVCKTIKCTELSFDCDVQIEYLCVDVLLSPQMHFMIMVLYNPPSTPEEKFCDELEKLLNVASYKSELIIFGDFNMDWFNKTRGRN